MTGGIGRTMRDRIGPFRHLISLFRLVWISSPSLTLGSLVLRLARSVLPILGLYLGKLIIDAVLSQVRSAPPGDDLMTWIASGRLDRLAVLLGLEFWLAILSNGLARASSLVDSLLSERYSNYASIRLMDHAATLDLEQLESSTEQDRLDRARRQVTGRTSLLTQMFGQAQDVLTAVSLAVGLAAYAPWLIGLLCLALIPGFLGEKHFNAQSYRLDYFRTPERRQLDYLRYLGSSTETAKEIKLFGLNGFLAQRFGAFAQAMYADSSRLALRRAVWGAVFAGLGSLAYYVAYFVIVWRTVSGHFSIGDLTFLAGSFLRLRGLLEGAASWIFADRRAGPLSRRPVLLPRTAADDRHAARAAAGSKSDPRGVRLRGRGLPVCRVRCLGRASPRPHVEGRRGPGAGGPERCRQDHDRQAAGTPLRSDGGPRAARRA